MWHAGSHTEEPTSSTADSGARRSFPEKLMSLLNSGDVDDAMRWLPGGDSFCIQPQRFAERVLEPHFRCKYESFTRKLNRCGYNNEQHD